MNQTITQNGALFHAHRANRSKSAIGNRQSAIPNRFVFWPKLRSLFSIPRWRREARDQKSEVSIQRSKPKPQMVGREIVTDLTLLRALPILNLPPDTLRIRIRQRDEIPLLYCQFPGGVQEYIAVFSDDKKTIELEPIFGALNATRECGTRVSPVFSESHSQTGCATSIK